MRCFGRAFGLAAATPRAFDLMVLRDEDLATDLAAPPAPVHFFLTAGRAAAALDVAFCLAMFALPIFGFDRERLAQNSIFVGLVPPKLRRRVTRVFDALWSEGGSVQKENPVHGAQFGGLDQPAMRHGDRE